MGVETKGRARCHPFKIDSKASGQERNTRFLLDKLLEDYCAWDEAIQGRSRHSWQVEISQTHRDALRSIATDKLFEEKPVLSARSLNSAALSILLTFVVGSLAIGISLSPVFGVMVAYLLAALFLTSSALRLWTLVNPASASRAPPELIVKEWPVYTILIPIFDEAEVVGQMVEGLSALSYPLDKLDIKFLVEEIDIKTQDALLALSLPAHCEVLVVPKGEPQTKPRALNYGLFWARGEFLTIYDGEDIPRPQQLKESVRLFRTRTDKTVCLQARLSFFNANENWLTRQFALEYAVHFGALLPTIARAQLPLLLGGTSNHFRVASLRKAGAWDPYNVTEDADLGLRFARLGFHAEMFASDTLEEAVTSLPSWMKQRSRWLKGLMITWLVHMRQPFKTGKSIGCMALWVTTALSLGAWLNAFLHPILLSWCLWSISGTQTFLQALISSVGIVCLLIDYFVYAILGQLWLKRTYGAWWAGTLLTFPLYWLLSHFAAWLALYDLVRSPFHWRKTRHGVSKLQEKF